MVVATGGILINDKRTLPREGGTYWNWHVALGSQRRSQVIADNFPLVDGVYTPGWKYLLASICAKTGDGGGQDVSQIWPFSDFKEVAFKAKSNELTIKT